MHEIDYSIKTLKERIQLVNKIIEDNCDSIYRHLGNVLIDDKKIPFNYLLHRLANYLLYLNNQPTYKQRRQFNFEKNTEEFIDYKYNLYTYPPTGDKLGDFEISDFRNLLNVDFFNADSWKPVLKLLRFNNMVSENVDRVIRIFYKCYGICDFTADENAIIRIYQRRQVKNSDKEFCIIKNIDISNKLNIPQTNVSKRIAIICKKLSCAYEQLFIDYYYTYLVKGTYKRCSKCGENKLIYKFKNNPTASDGKYSICKECLEENYKICSKCGKKLNKNMFGNHPKTKDGKQSWCKNCNSEIKNI
jgi:hypothetical protein